MHPGNKQLAFAECTERVRQVSLACTYRFYLGAGKLDAGNELFKELIIMRCPAVFDDDIAGVRPHHRLQANRAKYAVSVEERKYNLQQSEDDQHRNDSGYHHRQFLVVRRIDHLLHSCPEDI